MPPMSKSGHGPGNVACRRAAEHGRQDLADNAAADRAADGIAGLAEAQIFQGTARAVPPMAPAINCTMMLAMKRFHGIPPLGRGSAAAHMSPRRRPSSGRPDRSLAQAGPQFVGIHLRRPRCQRPFGRFSVGGRNSDARRPTRMLAFNSGRVGGGHGENRGGDSRRHLRRLAGARSRLAGKLPSRTISATWCTSRHRPSLGRSAPRQGLAIERWGQISARYEILSYDTHRPLIEKNRAAVEIPLHYRHRETGTVLETTKANFWTLEDGWPVKLTEYYDIADSRPFSLP